MSTSQPAPPLSSAGLPSPLDLQPSHPLPLHNNPSTASTVAGPSQLEANTVPIDINKPSGTVSHASTFYHFGTFCTKGLQFFLTSPQRIKAHYDELRVAGETDPTLYSHQHVPCSWPTDSGEMGNFTSRSTCDSGTPKSNHEPERSPTQPASGQTVIRRGHQEGSPAAIKPEASVCTTQTITEVDQAITANHHLPVITNESRIPGSFSGPESFRRDTSDPPDEGAHTPTQNSHQGGLPIVKEVNNVKVQEKPAAVPDASSTAPKGLQELGEASIQSVKIVTLKASSPGIAQVEHTSLTRKRTSTSSTCDGVPTRLDTRPHTALLLHEASTGNTLTIPTLIGKDNNSQIPSNNVVQTSASRLSSGVTQTSSASTLPAQHKDDIERPKGRQRSNAIIGSVRRTTSSLEQQSTNLGVTISPISKGLQSSSSVNKPPEAFDAVPASPPGLPRVTQGSMTYGSTEHEKKVCDHRILDDNSSQASSATTLGLPPPLPQPINFQGSTKQNASPGGMPKDGALEKPLAQTRPIAQPRSRLSTTHGESEKQASKHLSENEIEKQPDTYKPTYLAISSTTVCLRAYANSNSIAAVAQNLNRPSGSEHIPLPVSEHIPPAVSEHIPLPCQHIKAAIRYQETVLGISQNPPENAPSPCLLRGMTQAPKFDPQNTPLPPVPKGMTQTPTFDPLRDFKQLANTKEKWDKIEAKARAEGKPLSEEQLKWVKMFQKMQEKPADSAREAELNAEHKLPVVTDPEEEESKDADEKGKSKKKKKRRRKLKESQGQDADSDDNTKIENTPGAEDISAPSSAIQTDAKTSLKGKSQKELHLNSVTQKPSTHIKTLPAPGGLRFPAPVEGSATPQTQAPHPILANISKSLRVIAHPIQENSQNTVGIGTSATGERLHSFPPLPQGNVHKTKSELVIRTSQRPVQDGGRARPIGDRNETLENPHTSMPLPTSRKAPLPKIQVEPIPPVPPIPEQYKREVLVTPKQPHESSSKDSRPTGRPQTTKYLLIARVSKEVSQEAVEAAYIPVLKDLAPSTREYKSTEGSYEFKYHVASHIGRYLMGCLQRIFEEYKNDNILTTELREELMTIVSKATILRQKESFRLVDQLLNFSVQPSSRVTGLDTETGMPVMNTPTITLSHRTDQEYSKKEARTSVFRENLDCKTPNLSQMGVIVKKGESGSQVKATISLKQEPTRVTSTRDNPLLNTRSSQIHREYQRPAVIVHQSTAPKPKAKTHSKAAIKQQSGNTQSRWSPSSSDAETEFESDSTDNRPQVVNVVKGKVVDVVKGKRSQSKTQPPEEKIMHLTDLCDALLLLNMQEVEEEVARRVLEEAKWLKGIRPQDLTTLNNLLAYREESSFKEKPHEGNVNAKKGLAGASQSQTSTMRGPFFTRSGGDEWEYERIYSDDYFRLLNSLNPEQQSTGQNFKLGKRQREIKGGGCGVDDCTGCRACPGSSGRKLNPRGQCLVVFRVGEAVLVETWVDLDQEVDIVTINPVEIPKFTGLKGAGVYVKRWECAKGETDSRETRPKCKSTQTDPVDEIEEGSIDVEFTSEVDDESLFDSEEGALIEETIMKLEQKLQAVNSVIAVEKAIAREKADAEGEQKLVAGGSGKKTAPAPSIDNSKAKKKRNKKRK